MDIYAKRYKPNATQQEFNKIGRMVTLVGALLAVFLALAITKIQGLSFFNIFQSVLGFIAPPMAVAFLLGKRLPHSPSIFCSRWEQHLVWA